MDKVDNWILTAEAGASAPVTKALDLRLVAQDWYNNQPAPGRLKNDLETPGRHWLQVLNEPCQVEFGV